MITILLQGLGQILASILRIKQFVVYSTDLGFESLFDGSHQDLLHKQYTVEASHK